ncbi:DUF4153 domain-containing protein [Georhizobium profundi]|uniref:DUF4153 domain-containing protein n=1 Tax=Georhizobium profundi TaxID=2341112 RepID=A0A3S9B5E2_9HYPH|nr:DUF4153 domain-containing protein [Georhizobium profundi]AZN72185.1 DUF4153 domain-containing protein [Georhizobium profundi]
MTSVEQNQSSTGPRKGWGSVIGEMFDGTLKALRRFPVVALLLVLITIEANGRVGEWWPLFWGDRGFAYPLTVATIAALAVCLSLQSRRLGRLPELLLTGSAALLAFCLIEWKEAVRLYEQTFVVALAGLVLVGPFLQRGSSESFWLFVVRFLFAGLLGLLALLLFAGGFSAILASLTYLFGIAVPEQVYGHVWATVGCFAAPLFALGQLPAATDFDTPEDAPIPVRRGMQVLGDYVAAPLLIIYAVLLHIYAATIILSGDWPAGQVGWLVLTFGVCLFAALMVIHPFLSSARPPTRLLLRWWPVMLPVPLLLLLLATWQRISVYGVTPDRYLLVLFGVVTAATLLAQLRPSLRGDIRVIAALPVLALLVTSFGPQGAVSISIESQSERFRAMVADPPFTPEENAEALDILGYLEVAGGLGAVEPEALPSSAEAGTGLSRRIAVAYGLDPTLRTTGEAGQFSRSFQTSGVIATDDYDILIVDFSAYRGTTARNWSVPGLSQPLSISLRDNSLTLSIGGETVVFDVPVDTLLEMEDGTPSEAAEIKLSSQARQISIQPNYVTFDRFDEPSLVTIGGVLLFRLSDWSSDGPAQR